MDKKLTWDEIYQKHPIRRNLLNFLPLEKSEYVFYSPEHNEKPLDLMELIQLRNQKKCSYIIIACDNKYALKMFAGVMDEKKRFFAGLRDETDATVYARAELEKELERYGLKEYQFFYPYPNYQLPLAIYSDSYQPKQGELSNNLRNFAVQRGMIFDETKAWDQIIKDGLFTTFTNSFLLVIGPALPWKQGNVIFSKFSNDRNQNYAIRTDICEENGKRWVQKRPVEEAARKHIAKLPIWEERLTQTYEQFAFDHCTIEHEMAILEYLEGQTLDELLITHLQKGEMDTFFSLVRKYVDVVCKAKNTGVIDVDLIFKNILVSKEGVWNVLDYEWTFDTTVEEDAFIKKLTNEFVAFRSLYYFVEDNRVPLEIANQLYAGIDLTPEKKEEYLLIEQEFQAYVARGHRTLGQLYGEYQGHVHDFMAYVNEKETEYSTQIKAFQDGQCVKVFADEYLRRSADLCEWNIEVEENWDQLEIVLSHSDMILDMQTIQLDGGEQLLSYKTNGWLYREHLYLFRNVEEKPKLMISLPHKAGHLYIRYTMKGQGDNTSATFSTLCYQLLQENNKFWNRLKRRDGQK